MTPFTRNIALAALAVVLPAIAGAAIAPERARALPVRIGHRVRDLFEDDDSVEDSLRRITARLEDLSHQIDAYGGGAVDRMRDTSTTTRVLAAIGALLVVPAALAAIFASERVRAGGARIAGDATVGDDAMESWDDDLDDLEGELQAQRDDAYSAVTGAAGKAS